LRQRRRVARQRGPPRAAAAPTCAIDFPLPGRGSAPKMATQKELSDFLAGVERRAFKQAAFAVRDDDSALDIVQEAMIKLSQHYAERPAPEFPLLFTRILQNAIHDHFRRLKVRSSWLTLFSQLPQGDDDDVDPLERLESESGSPGAESAADKVEREQIVRVIEEEMARLPARQREAFVLRYWEDLDVAETAATMGCSEGSVKTHCSRATHALARALRGRGITL
jgi:RNA polymerase sigma-70 factor, ECF subfamily